MKFIKDTLVTFSSQMIGVVFGIITVVAIARVLGPSGKGSYSLIILVPILLISLGNLGIGIANVYFCGSKKYKLSDLASNSLISALMLGIFLSLIAFIFLYFFYPAFLRDVDLQPLFIAIFATPFSLLLAYFSFILLGEGKINQYNLLHIFQSSVLAVLVLGSLFVIETGLRGVISAWVGSILIASALSFLLVHKLTEIKWAFHHRLFKDSVKFGIKGAIGNVALLLNYRLDMLLVSAFIGVTAVGYYSVAVSLAEALWYFPSAVAMMIFARTPGLSSEQANKSAPVICRNTLFITLMGALILSILGKIIITFLFGPVFLPALRPLWVLLPGIVTFSVCRVLANDLAGRGRPIFITIAAITSLIFNIALNLLLIPQWGITGAALASTISYTISTIVILIYFCKVSKTNWLDVILIRPQDIHIYTNVLLSFYTRLYRRK